MNEILALEKLGNSIQIFVSVNPHEKIVQVEVDQIRARVEYLDAPGSFSIRNLLRENWHVLLRLGTKYLRAFLYALRNHQIDQGYTASGRFACFFQAVHIVDRLRQQENTSGMPVEHLHAHFAHDPTLIAQLIHRMTGIPFSFTAHARDLYQVPEPVLISRIQQASAVVTCCRTNLEYLSRIAPNNVTKYRLIYHGVKLDGFQPPAEVTHQFSIPVLLSVGRLVEKKGYPDLFAALAKVKEMGGKFRLEIYGDGPLKPALEKWINQHDMAAEIFLQGERTQKELIPIYQAANLFILTPSITEDGDRDGIPNVLLEAMAVGLPVISTEVAGIPELVRHNQNGMLYPPHAVEEIANGIMELLANGAKRRRLGQAARRRVVEEFDVSLAALQLNEIFECA